MRGKYCNAPVRPNNNSGKPIINTQPHAAMKPSSAPTPIIVYFYSLSDISLLSQNKAYSITRKEWVKNRE